MDLKAITVTLDPTAGAFPEDPLACMEAKSLPIGERCAHQDRSNV